MVQNTNFKILLAKPGLDGHDVGAKIIVRTLLDAGFDVVYTGMRKTPEEIVLRAQEEHVDVLGLSILSGSHLPVCRRIAELLLERGLGDLVWIVGGNIPVNDCDELKKMGVHEVFPVGTNLDSIVDFLQEKLT